MLLPNNMGDGPLPLLISKVKFNDHFFANPPVANAFETWDFSGTSKELARIVHSKPFALDGRTVKVKTGTTLADDAFRVNQACASVEDVPGGWHCPIEGSSIYH